MGDVSNGIDGWGHPIWDFLYIGIFGLTIFFIGLFFILKTIFKYRKQFLETVNTPTKIAIIGKNGEKLQVFDNDNPEAIFEALKQINT